MGASSSSPLTGKASLLAQLGSSQLAHDDPFWKLFLSHGLPLAILNPHDVEQEAGAHFRHAAALNPTTHNCQNLLVHTISLLNEAAVAAPMEETVAAFHANCAANALHMVGLAVKAAADMDWQLQSRRLSSEMLPQIVALFEVPPSLPMPAGLVHQGETETNIASSTFRKTSVYD
jgi:hypothetical protein